MGWRGILGKGTKGLWTPIGLIGDLGTGLGGRWIKTRPLLINTSKDWLVDHDSTDQEPHKANKVDKVGNEEA